MIYSAFTKIFWGFLLVFLDIRLFMPIDLFADPIGYFLIFSGVHLLVNDFPIGRKAKYLSITLSILSIPTLFYDKVDAGVGEYFSYLNWYLSALGLAHYILIFFVFQLIVEIANRSKNENLIRRSSTTFIAFFIVTFVIYLWTTFAINLPMHSNWVISVSTLLLIIGFIMGILFLTLLWSTRNVRI